MIRFRRHASDPSRSIWARCLRLLALAGLPAIAAPPPELPCFKAIINQSSQCRSGEWKGPKDASATVTLTRTTSGLAIHIEVTDDDRVNPAPPSEPWRGDSVELYFDFRPARKAVRNIYERGVFKLTICPQNEGHTPTLIFFPDDAATRFTLSPARCRLTPTGYILDLLLPAEALAERHFPLRSEFGFDIGLNDADGGGTYTRLLWHGTLDNWKNPADFGRARLSLP